MQPEQFDDLARALAHGMPRRYVLKALAAGAGLASFFGLGGPVVNVAKAVGDEVVFLPMVAGKGATSACPPARVCGAECCPDGTVCVGDACIADLSGTWSGAVAYAGQSIGIRFVIQRSGDDLSGRMLMQDPESQEFLETGAISGQVTGDMAAWITEADSFVEGTFVGNGFSGTFDFPDRAGETGFQATIDLQRTA